MKTTERRYLPIADAEMRAVKADDDTLMIEGYPIVYEKYANMWGWREIIRRGAATEALKRSDEVVLWNHESGQPMARKKNRTLEVKEDKKGVFIRANISGTVWGRDGYEAIENEVVDKMSFAFDIAGEGWIVEEFDGVKLDIREITRIDVIYDYSPVTYPAYEDTQVEARSKQLALRNKPKPGAPGAGSAAAQEVRKDARDNIHKLVRRLKHGH